MEVGGQLYAPAALPPVKNAVPIELEAGWSTELVWIFRRTDTHTYTYTYTYTYRSEVFRTVTTSSMLIRMNK